jgi:hypothetical protein
MNMCGTDAAQYGGMKSIPSEVTNIESKIYIIRGQKVMLDFDLAELYQVPNGEDEESHLLHLLSKGSPCFPRC